MQTLNVNLSQNPNRSKKRKSGVIATIMVNKLSPRDMNLPILSKKVLLM
ncbi:MAG: hypothetical protein CH6_1561 [Candidatus Kapaibacterium sp.]|nr:MAG: hypothetical protein CH6_1561 [Candidatus Kapabacteria bacterium]